MEGDAHLIGTGAANSDGTCADYEPKQGKGGSGGGEMVSDTAKPVATVARTDELPIGAEKDGFIQVQSAAATG